MKLRNEEFKELLKIAVEKLRDDTLCELLKGVLHIKKIPKEKIKQNQNIWNLT